MVEQDHPTCTRYDRLPTKKNTKKINLTEEQRLFFLQVDGGVETDRNHSTSVSD